MIVKNRNELLSVCDRASRTITLDIMEETLKAADLGLRIRNLVRLEGDILQIGYNEWDLSLKKNIYIIATGQSVNSMCMAFEEILGDRLTRGYAVLKKLEPTDTFKKFKIAIGGHPLPTKEGMQATLRIVDVVDASGPDDLFICLTTGGCSALMACPRKEFSLEEEIMATDIMHKNGANILEVNSVRRHISMVNGGRLAQRIEARGAEIISFLAMDITGYPRTEDDKAALPFWGSPAGPDDTTIADARAAIRNYDLKDKLPQRIVDFFENATEADETPKSFKNYTQYRLGTLPDLCAEAQRQGEARGIRSHILTSSLDLSGGEFGKFMAALAREIQDYRQPFEPPCLLIASGETTLNPVDLSTIRGMGGSCQETAASFAIYARDIKGACLLSMDTEGTDGPTDAAGGITDSLTFDLAAERGVDLYKAVRWHATYNALSKLDSRIETGNTGTNLCDLHLLYVPPKSEGR